MVDAIISTVLRLMTSIITEQGMQEVRLVVGVEEEIRKLASNFEAIQAIIRDAERKQVRDASVRVWMHKLKDVSYDVEDVLDEWKAFLLKLKIIRQHNNHNKVCSFLSTSCFHIKGVSSRRNMAVKIKDLNRKLEIISEEKQTFQFVHKSEMVEARHITTSIVDVVEVCGRGQDQMSVKNMLLEANSRKSCQGNDGFRIVSIVGIGGIGKTTVARLVYNDGEIIDHFDQKMWICVSDAFDEKRIAKEVLEACIGTHPKLEGLDIILHQICRHIMGKRVLLVLDDVWTEEFWKWEQIMDTLKCAMVGSRILVTTRNQKVAIAMGSRHVDVYHLEVLNEKDSCALFTQLSLSEKVEEEMTMFEGVGRKILAKCDGLPLAIKIIGSHLRFKMTIEEWKHVLRSEFWNIQDVEKGLMAPLLLSYYELSSFSKRCFLYCAFFPKDYIFQKDKLANLWIAQDFFGEAKESELIVEECFNDLAARCFFQDFRKDESGKIGAFKMHDIIHDFALYLNEGECYSMIIHNMKWSMKETTDEGTRHMQITMDHLDKFQLSNVQGYKKLRSFHIECNPTYWRTKLDLRALDWEQIICLRTLKLRNLHLKELPNEIGKLLHLRYLDLAYNRKLKALPEGMCDLCNLKRLDISCCFSLKRLPQRMGELIKLTHLENWGTNEIKSMPKGVGRLRNLKHVSYFTVSGEEKDAGLTELGALENLSATCIEIHGLGNTRVLNDSKKTKLQNKILQNMKLDFKAKAGKLMMNVEQEQVFEALVAPSSVKSLSIYNYKGRPQLPIWMISLHNLTVLSLRYCGNWDQLPPVGKLPRLETLYISDMWLVKKVGNEFLGLSPEVIKVQNSVAFPYLSSLHIRDMIQWKEWDSCEQENPMVTIMPRLCTLEIQDCFNLKALPQHILRKTTLQKLRVINCFHVEERCDKEKGEDWPFISHIPTIEIKHFIDL